MYVQFTYCVQGLSKTNFFQQQLYLLINKLKKNIKRKLKGSIKSFFKQQKNTIIPPLFHEDKFVTQFRKKANFLLHFLQKILPSKN